MSDHHGRGPATGHQASSGSAKDDGRRRPPYDVQAASATITGEDRDDGRSAPCPDAGPQTPAVLQGSGLFAAVKRTFKHHPRAVGRPA